MIEFPLDALDVLKVLLFTACLESLKLRLISMPSGRGFKDSGSRSEGLRFMEQTEIMQYLKMKGFGIRHLLDAWKEDDDIFYITGIEGIPGTQTMIQIDQRFERYRNRRMRPGSVWTEWMKIA